MIEAYQRRNRAQGVYFREMYALICNVNRDPEKSQALSGEDIIKLPGDEQEQKAKRQRQPRKNPESAANWSAERWADYIKRINES